MKIFSVSVGMMGVNCYIVTFDGVSCAVIDPGDDCEKIMSTVSANGIKIDKILLTHGHFDHFGGAEQLKQRTNAKLFISKYDAPMLNDDSINVAGMFGMSVKHTSADEFYGDTVALGGGALKVIPTPGHSTGSVCFYAEEEKTLFSGDTLFAGGVGRTDFFGGSFETLERSIKEKLFVLPDDTKVYPGHNGMTTIGDEKKYNPYL